MKKLLSLLATVMLVAFVSCSKGEDDGEKFNAAETRALITEYDANGGKLTPEQYSTLIKNTRLLFSDIKVRMKELLGITEPLRFTQEYQRLKHDNDFMELLVVREQVWRVLVMGQRNFSEQNKAEFHDLPDECMLIDYYDDCIRSRVTDAENDSII
ncbi:MAG: hypothetical protein K2L55_05610 [Muribaculaceae bacterium]|nr:hypothetical protein [Muribaculaceae bacterium]